MMVCVPGPTKSCLMQRAFATIMIMKKIDISALETAPLG
jgi:hypothetical protein